MKTLLSYLAVAALVITSSFTVNQQQQLNEHQSPNSCFSRFNAHRAGKAAIQLSWTVASTDIAQFVVERSYDGDFFETLNTIDFDGSASYKSKDNDVYPGVLYYRVAAFYADGSMEYSPVETVRIVQHG